MTEGDKMAEEKHPLGRDVYIALAAVGWADGNLDLEEAYASVRTAEGLMEEIQIERPPARMTSARSYQHVQEDRRSSCRRLVMAPGWLSRTAARRTEGERFQDGKPRVRRHDREVEMSRRSPGPPVMVASGELS
jgi:hypothetical protein